MARKATNQVTTIGIDIGKNRFHLIGPDGRFRSKVPVSQGHRPRLDLAVKQTKSGPKPT